MYTLRNKRNIAHKNDVDTNTHDLAFAHQGAAWITAELLRHATGVSMQEPVPSSSWCRRRSALSSRRLAARASFTRTCR